MSQSEKSALSLQQVIAAPLVAVVQVGAQVAAVNAESIKERQREGLPVVWPPLLAVSGAEFVFVLRIRHCARAPRGSSAAAERVSEDMRRFLDMKSLDMKVTIGETATNAVAGPRPVVQMTIKTRVEAASRDMVAAGVSRGAK